MDVKEAAALLSEFEYRGYERWIINKTKTFYRGEVVEKNVFVLPDPSITGGTSNGPVFLPVEAIAIASLLRREELQQALDEDVRQG